MNYYQKYLKYKNKYLQLKNQYGGSSYKKKIININKKQIPIVTYFNGGRTQTYILFINEYIIPGYFLKEIFKNIEGYNYFSTKNNNSIIKENVDPIIPLFYFIGCTKLILPNSNYYIDILPEQKLYDNYLYGFFITKPDYNKNGNIPNQSKLEKFLNAINDEINKNQMMKDLIIQITLKTKDILKEQNDINKNPILKQKLFSDSLTDVRIKLDDFNKEFNKNKNNNCFCDDNDNYKDKMELNLILQDERGIINIGNTCYMNSILHLITPIILNIILNSDVSKFNYTIELKTDIITEDIIRNIINKTIIPLVYFDKDKNNLQNFDNLYNNLINFANIFIRYDIENNKCIVELNNKGKPLGKYSQEDASELLVRLLDNLVSLGYCLKYNYQGLYLIKFILNAENKFDNAFNIIQPQPMGIINLSPMNNNYNLQTLLDNTIKGIELLEGTYDIIPGKFQVTGLLNNSNEMPIYVLLKINLETFDLGKNIFFPEKIGNIIINNTIYEPSDIVCQFGSFSAGHYICYSKRFYNRDEKKKIKWIRYDDSSDTTFFEDNNSGLNNMLNNMKSRTTPYIFSFKKKYLGNEKYIFRSLDKISNLKKK